MKKRHTSGLENLNHNKRATPRKFRALRLLVIGCGDVGQRLLSLTRHSMHCIAVARRPRPPQLPKPDHVTQPDIAKWPSHGHMHWLALDAKLHAKRLAGLARHMIVLAPPDGHRRGDALSFRLAAALSCYQARQKGHQPERTQPRSICYISTTGVYGDHQGRWINETSKLLTQSARAQRRVATESIWRTFGRQRRGRMTILRAPGIYASQRLPLERLRTGTPVICSEEDSYSNHIHADDLARISLIACLRGKSMRIFNAVDDLPLKMGDYYRMLADHFGLDHPPEQHRAEIQKSVSAMTWSFMAESRQIDNTRMKKELRIKLRYPTIQAALNMFTVSYPDPHQTPDQNRHQN